MLIIEISHNPQKKKSSSDIVSLHIYNLQCSFVKNNILQLPICTDTEKNSEIIVIVPTVQC